MACRWRMGVRRFRLWIVGSKPRQGKTKTRRRKTFSLWSGTSTPNYTVSLAFLYDVYRTYSIGKERIVKGNFLPQQHFNPLELTVLLIQQSHMHCTLKYTVILVKLPFYAVSQIPNFTHSSLPIPWTQASISYLWVRSRQTSSSPMSPASKATSQEPSGFDRRAGRRLHALLLLS